MRRLESGLWIGNVIGLFHQLEVHVVPLVLQRQLIHVVPQVRRVEENDGGADDGDGDEDEEQEAIKNQRQKAPILDDVVIIGRRHFSFRHETDVLRHLVGLKGAFTMV